MFIERSLQCMLQNKASPTVLCNEISRSITALQFSTQSVPCSLSRCSWRSGAVLWLVGGHPEDPVGLSPVVPAAPELSGRHCTSWYGFTWTSCCVNYVANCISFRLKKLACGTPVKRGFVASVTITGGSLCSTDGTPPPATQHTTMQFLIFVLCFR